MSLEFKDTAASYETVSWQFSEFKRGRESLKDDRND
jgi:hypothetical protein